MTSGPRHHIAALTGLRAVAALMVVGTHAFFWTGNYTEDAFGYFGARLEAGVALFFALSGYLLFRRWVHSQRTGAPLPATWQYLRRRARRILPAYWIVITVVYLVYLVRDAGPFGRGWNGYLRNMTLTQIYGYGHAHESLTQMWSIAIEASFYLVLPAAGWAITVLIRRRNPAPYQALLFVVLLAAMSPLWIWATHSDGFYALPGIDAAGVDITAQLWLPGFFAWFAGGMALAVIEPELRDRGWLGPGIGRERSPGRSRGRTIRGLGTGACLLVAGGAYAAACTAFAGTGTIMPADLSQSLTKNSLYTVFAVATLTPLVLARTGSRPGPYERFLASRPIVWLGGISYEIFLIHLLVMDLMMDAIGYRPFHGSIFTLFEVTILVTVPLAWLLARLTQPRRERRPRTRRTRSGDGRPQPRQRPVAENSSSTAFASDKSTPSPATQSSSK